ncbi:phospholipase [Nissabacter sp. SGAir0207]|nr:phospholipase [Nissabacter sp. SGAir0207]
MKIKKYSLILLAALFSLPVISYAHNDSGYSHDANIMDYSQSDWMAKLDNYTPLGELAIPGTHDSGSRYGGASVANQVMTIDQQLRAGIRFLDIRVRHIDDSFAIHHGFVYQKMNFNDVMKQVTQFLSAHPTEIVFMRLRDEYDGESTNSIRSANETLDEYLAQYEKWISHRNKAYPLETVGAHRGQIYFLWDNLYPQRTLTYGQFFGQQLQDAYQVKTNWDLYGKWEKVKAFLEASRHFSGQQIALNYLSASGGSFPYFVASGHSSSGTSASRLSTGLTTPGFKHRYPDFPRVSCFIGICTIAFEGTNTLTKNYLNNRPDMKPQGIIAADFPGKGLIQAIINKNRFVK